MSNDIESVTLKDLRDVIGDLSAAFVEIDEAIIPCAHFFYVDCLHDDFTSHDQSCPIADDPVQVRWQQPRQTFQERETPRSPWCDVDDARAAELTVCYSEAGKPYRMPFPPRRGERRRTTIDELLDLAETLGIDDAADALIAQHRTVAA